MLKPFKWNLDKNIWLKQHRGISFEDIVLALANNQLLDIKKHANTHKYPNQFIYSIKIHNYVYYVPFVETNNYIFLKTIIPSRKATKQYLKKEVL